MLRVLSVPPGQRLHPHRVQKFHEAVANLCFVSSMSWILDIVIEKISQ